MGRKFFSCQFFFGWVGCPLSKTIVVDAPLKKSLGFEVWNIKIKWQRSCQLVFEVVVEYRGKKTLGTFYWRSKMKVWIINLIIFLWDKQHLFISHFIWSGICVFQWQCDVICMLQHWLSLVCTWQLPITVFFFFISRARKLQLRKFSASQRLNDDIGLDQPLPNFPELKYAVASRETYDTPVTTLENGLRVASQKMFGHFCTLGGNGHATT